MKIRERAILEDMQAYIQFELDHDLSEGFHRVIATLAHDVSGIINETMCFSPRTSGYKRRMEYAVHKNDIR
jgi:hypothetical protein